MNVSIGSISKFILAAVVAASLGACATAPAKPKGADELRSKLTQLQSDPQLSSRAAVAIKDAESAVSAAEQPQKDQALGQHLVFIADRKIQIAEAVAQSRMLEDQRKSLSAQRERARLDSRTREVDVARQGTAEAQQQNAELESQIAELKARKTPRGLVVTLGDLLFATGKSTLRDSSSNQLDKLVAFLQANPDRTVMIEGYTDSVGSEAMNAKLSLQRADAVKAYLVGRGIADQRLQAKGKGEGSPVASNDTASGRQQNRRVEIIIVNTATSAR
jgi:outer membrane protein OmpA-like peptidoglycan-associated protein